MTDGRHQEEESAPLVAAFFSGLPVGTLNVARIIIRLSTANLLSGMQGESF